jgi:hypothetical protein
MVTPPKDGYVKYRVRKKEVREFRNVGTEPGTMIRHQWTTWYSKRVELFVEMAFASNTIDQLSRISSLNPASIMWELTPYSFVADWLLNIGQYIRNLETAFVNDQHFVAGYRTDSYKKIDDGVKYGAKSIGPGISLIYGGCQQIDRDHYKNRIRLTSYPTPRYPTVKLQMGSSRIISGAALLSQFLSKGRA